MTADERLVQEAARAAGEAMPGVTGDSRSREATPQAQAFERLVSLLRSASLPSSEERRGQALVRVKQRATTHARWRRVALVAACLLAVLVPLITWRLSRPTKSILYPPAADVSSAAVFAEVFVARTWEPTDPPPAFPPPAGTSRTGPAFLRPFAEQAEFPLLVLGGLPRETQLMAARYRKGGPGVRPFTYLWLEYAGPEGRTIVLQVPDEPSAQAAIEALHLPVGWLSTSRTESGVRALVAAETMSREALAAVAERLAPYAD